LNTRLSVQGQHRNSLVKILVTSPFARFSSGMSVSPKSLWRVPVFTPYLHPALTEEALQKAEKEIGFKLGSSTNFVG